MGQCPHKFHSLWAKAPIAPMLPPSMCNAMHFLSRFLLCQQLESSLFLTSHKQNIETIWMVTRLLWYSHDVPTVQYMNGRLIRISILMIKGSYFCGHNSLTFQPNLDLCQAVICMPHYRWYHTIYNRFNDWTRQRTSHLKKPWGAKRCDWRRTTGQTWVYDPSLVISMHTP